MIKPRALRHNRISAMAEVQEVVIYCVALFYEEGQGVGGIIERKTSLGVESTCKRNGWSSLERPFGKLRVL